MTDVQFSSVAILNDIAEVQERVTYSAYGRARHHRFADVDGDGDSDSIGDWATISGLSGKTITDSQYRAECDLDRDGDIDSTDYTLASSPGAQSAISLGFLTTADVDNQIGYDGYVFNVEVELYHVRFRAYDPELGRWLERDRSGYLDQMNLYQYVGSNSIRYLDPLGLLRTDPTPWWKKVLKLKTPLVYFDDNCNAWRCTGRHYWRLESREIFSSLNFSKINIPGSVWTEIISTIGWELAPFLLEDSVARCVDAGDNWLKWYQPGKPFQGVSCRCGWRKYEEACRDCCRTWYQRVPEGSIELGSEMFRECDEEFYVSGIKYTYGTIVSGPRGRGAFCTCVHSNPDDVRRQIRFIIEEGRVDDVMIERLKDAAERLRTTGCPEQDEN